MFGEISLGLSLEADVKDGQWRALLKPSDVGGHGGQCWSPQGVDASDFGTWALRVMFYPSCGRKSMAAMRCRPRG